MVFKGKVELKPVHRELGITLLVNRQLYESVDWQMFQVCTDHGAKFGITDFHIISVGGEAVGASFAHPVLFKLPHAHTFERVYWGQVYVKPEFRGFGFGKRLAEAIKVRPLRFNASELQTVKNWPGRYLPEEITEV